MSIGILRGEPGEVHKVHVARLNALAAALKAERAKSAELLAALVRLKRDGCNCAVNEPHQGGCDACGQARAAIARATGGKP